MLYRSRVKDPNKVPGFGCLSKLIDLSATHITEVRCGGRYECRNVQVVRV